MKTTRMSLIAATIFVAAASDVRAQGARVLWSNPWSNAATVASHVWTNPVADVEAADDFDLHATITRVVVDANGCSSCTPPVVAGATVRFYQWSQGDVGALQHQVFVAAGSPALSYRVSRPETVDITLPSPFVATGKHFVSVQLHFVGGGYWNVWVGNWGNPTLASVKVRDRLGSGLWTTPTVYPWPSPQIIGDLTFQLWGVPRGSVGEPAIPCTTWSPLALDGPPGNTTSQLRDVKVLAVDDVWAVGHSQVPNGPNTDSFTTVVHWDGDDWTHVPSPSPGPAPGLVNCLLSAIDGTSNRDLWAAGTFHTVVPGGWVGQQVFAMHWDGTRWSVPAGLPLPNTSIGAGISGSQIHDVKSIASNDVWFVGDWLDLTSPSHPITIRPGLLLRWNGGSFEQTILPVVTGVGHQYLNAVAASRTDDVWVVGGAGVPGNLPGSSVPVVFHWNGSSWTHRPFTAPPGNVHLYDVEVVARNDVWVFGLATRQIPTPTTTRFLAHWDGANWTLLPGPPAGIAGKVFAANDIWSVGAAVWHFDGTTWTQKHEFGNALGASLSGVDAIAPCQLFGVGGQSRVGRIAPFAARQDHAQLWRTRTRLSLLPERTPGSLQSLGCVRPGATLSVGIDDPGRWFPGTQATTFWWATLRLLPTPVTLPFGGRSGGIGELFVDPASPGFVTGPVVWRAGQGSAVHAFAMPADPTLVGVDLFTQGLMLDAAPPMTAMWTNGLDLHVGW